jgi:hypothetical protein
MLNLHQEETRCGKHLTFLDEIFDAPKPSVPAESAKEFRLRGDKITSSLNSEPFFPLNLPPDSSRGGIQSTIPKLQ